MEIKRSGLFTYHTLNEKERKNLMILELIRKKGPISRTDISKVTEINIVSISTYMKNFIDKKFVLEKGLDVSSGGRRPELVEFNTKGAYIIGVEINNTRLAAVLSDLALAAAAKSRISRAKVASEDETTKSVIGLIQDVISKSAVKKDDIRAIGIGVCRDNFVRLRDAVEEEFGIETFMGSDAACAAFGEKRLNPEADVEDLLYMYSDVGCGIIIRGDIYFGAGGAAGEILSFNEQIAKEEDMPFNSYQYLRPWCVELGITQSAKREITRGIGTKIVALAGGDIENVTKQVVIEAARQNDEIALDIVRGAGVNLGIRTAYLVNLFDPEIVVIGGCIEKAGELILGPIKNEVNKFCLNRKASKVKIIPSALGDDNVTLGAASLAIREIFLKA